MNADRWVTLYLALGILCITIVIVAFNLPVWLALPGGLLLGVGAAFLENSLSR